MNKLVYIISELQEDTDTHFFHNYETLKLLSERMSLFVIVERGKKPKVFRGYAQKFRLAPLRVFELFCVLLVLRIRGYRTFWTHYSFVGSIVASFFGKSFYWNCGMPWLYERSAFEEWQFRQALRRSILVTGTESIKNMYVKQYALLPQRVRVLPNGIYIERFAAWDGRREEARHILGIEKDKKVILFIHRLSKRKGADRIVPVAHHFQHNPDVLFVVCGQGPLESQIRGEFVRKEGAVPQRDIPMYLAAADIFFMPSEEEGFPHVLLEAMACGVPIVASDVGGVRDMVPADVLPYIVNQDTEIFALKIKELLDDVSLRKTIGNEERRHVKCYELSEVVTLLLEVIRR